MPEYMEISHFGVTCYTDAFIANMDTETLFFVSLFGRPVLVKAIAAAIVEGRSVKAGELVLRRPYNQPLRTFTQNNGGVMHKALLCEPYFNGSEALIVVGEDKKRAFQFLDGAVSTPLKEEWADTLWTKVFEPRTLFGFGAVDGTELNPVYLLTVTKTVDEVDELVLDGIRAGELH